MQRPLDTVTLHGPTMRHAFTDESSRGDSYTMCVTVVDSTEVGPVSQALRNLPKGKGGRLHATTDGDRTKKRALTAIAEFGVPSTIYATRFARAKDQMAARDAILEAMTVDLQKSGVGRLILDHGFEVADRVTIGRSRAPQPEFRFEHRHSRHEPLLWVPDLVGWAWGRGGDWRRRTSEIVLSVEQIPGP